MKIRIRLLLACLLLANHVTNAGYTFATNNGALTITGFTGSGVITVPASTNGYPVTAIAANAFFDNMNLKSVTVPGSVTNIGGFAFLLCTSLTNVTVNTGILSISDDAFENDALKTFTIPSTLTNVPADVFNGCDNLASITVNSANPVFSSSNGVWFDKNVDTIILVPAGLTGNYTIPSSVTNLPESCFEYCELGSVTIPGSIVDFGVSVFYQSIHLTNVIIQPGVTAIPEGAFDSCSALGSVTIPNTVTNIGPSAFYSCFDLTNLTIPSRVTTIGDQAFYFCSSLRKVVIPASVTSLGSDVFDTCTSLTNVTIQSGVTNFGSFEFNGDTNLLSVFFSTNAPAADSSVFNDTGKVTAYYLNGTTGWTAFSSATGIPAVLWNPQIGGSDPTLGINNNDEFGFTISSSTSIPIVVETCSNFANPVWSVLTNVTVQNGGYYFSDAHSANYPGRFYRITSP